MLHQRLHFIILTLIVCLCSGSVFGGVLLVEDSFDGTTLDTSKWQLVNGEDVSITQVDSNIVFDRPTTQLNYLATAQPYNPAVTPLVITGSVTLGADADMSIWTRASLTANSSPGHVLNAGIRINFWADAYDQGWPPHLDILEKTADVWPWDSTISDGGEISGDDEVLDWSFVITDDGTTITATLIQTSDPSNQVTLTGTSSTQFDENYVAITVVNGVLHDVTIVATPLAALVEDDFEGTELDTDKWQTINGEDVNIIQADGQVSFNRSATQLNYLATALEFDPAVTPLKITGSALLGADADMSIWTRACLTGNTGGGPGHVLDSGIRVNFWADAVDQGWPPNLDILKKTAGVWSWDSTISGGSNITGDDEVLDWDFVITDDGSTITATFTQTSDPNNTLTLTGTSSTDFDTDYVALTVVNGTLLDVSITAQPADPLVNDDFSGDDLDTDTWQTFNGSTANITQEDGQIVFDRPENQPNYLLTNSQYDPAATPLVITGSATLGADPDMSIWTRTQPIANDSPSHVLNEGVRINFWADAMDQGWPPCLIIQEKTPDVWPWDGSISNGADIAGDDEVLDWSFVITDNGNVITATFIQTSDPTNILTCIGVCDTDFVSDQIALTVVNGTLNDVCIMAKVTEGGFTDDFEAPQDYMTEGLGEYAGKLGDFEVLDANLSAEGCLYMQTVESVWDPGPGPMLYVEVIGDFVATVKVTDFAGDVNEQVISNDAGLLARDPASDGVTENWVSMNYFPTWTAFVARSTVDGTREELGQTAAYWEGVDTYALAEQYPYIQLERSGSDFYFRISADGVTFRPLTEEAYLGIYDGSQEPLVISRPDLPAKLQLGLMNATYSDAVGYVAFDDFTVEAR